MAKGMNWHKAKRFRQYEHKIKPGTVLPNGSVVPRLPPDSLKARAERALSEWLDGMKPSKRRHVERLLD